VPLPSWIHIVAIEAEDMESFVEGLTPAVGAAVPQAVAVIRSVLAHAPPRERARLRPASPALAPAGPGQTMTNAEPDSVPTSRPAAAMAGAPQGVARRATIQGRLIRNFAIAILVRPS